MRIPRAPDPDPNGKAAVHVTIVRVVEAGDHVWKMHMSGLVGVALWGAGAGGQTTAEGNGGMAVAGCAGVSDPGSHASRHKCHTRSPFVWHFKPVPNACGHTYM